jgi:hypothetical protein
MDACAPQILGSENIYPGMPFDPSSAVMNIWTGLCGAAHVVAYSCDCCGNRSHGDAVYRRDDAGI